MNPCLLLVDVQNDYFAGGALPVPGAEAAAGRAAALLGAWRGRGWPVIHVRHESRRPGAAFLLSGTAGAELHSAVAPAAGEPVVVKHYPNSFRDTELAALLAARRSGEVVLAGMMTQMCIDATARAAFDLGFGVRLAADACAARALQFGGQTVPAAQVHAAFLAALHGVYGQVVETAALLVSD